jgi:methylase of polypeptide subunit release factors
VKFLKTLAAVKSDAMILWQEQEQTCSAHWHSEHGSAPPKRVMLVDDTLSADSAFRLASEGTGLLWRGDFQNAKQLLQAIARRLDKPGKKSARAKKTLPSNMKEVFNQHRQTQSQRARTLGMVLLHFNADHSLSLRRSPDVAQACHEAYGDSDAPYVISLRELLGVVGAHEWRKKGVKIAALDGRSIHPHYGVFAPLRAEYLQLVAQASMPASWQTNAVAFDIGTGTGVLAAILIQRGVSHVIATDQSDRALACAKENSQRLGYADQIEIVAADLYPQGEADLIVCNPPWVPARPSSALEHAVFDPESKMLHGFLQGLAAHLKPTGEGWLILSDLAEHLELRSRDALTNMFQEYGLRVLEKLDAKPMHAKATDQEDALHTARAAEVVSLWRLARA